MTEFPEHDEKELMDDRIADVEDSYNEEDEEEVDIMRIPRTGKRQLTPIERLR